MISGTRKPEPTGQPATGRPARGLQGHELTGGPPGRGDRRHVVEHPVVLVVERMNTVEFHRSGLAAIAAILAATNSAPAAGRYDGCSEFTLVGRSSSPAAACR